MKISELKKEARMKLTGKWPLAIEINLLHLVITLTLTYVANRLQGITGAIIALVLGILTIPLSYGLTASMLKLSRDEVVGVTDFISIGFKNFKRAFFLSLSVFIRILIPSILIFVAAVLSVVSAFTESGILSLVALILVIASMIWLFCKVLSYALSTYVLVDNEDMKSKEAIAKSCELMKGNRLKFIGLVLSFFGWLLLSGVLAFIAQSFNELLGTVVTYGLSLLLAPYITFTEINFYEDLAGTSEVKVETSEEPTVE